MRDVVMRDAGCGCGLTLIAGPTNRYEDFSECFAMYCEEQEPGATGIFNTVSNHFESSVTVRLRLFSSLALQPPLPDSGLMLD